MAVPERTARGLVAALALILATPVVRAEVRVEVLAYGEDARQVLDLYTPAEPAGTRLPTIVLAHGGLWESGSRASLEVLCRNLVSRSGEPIACASIDYRLSFELGGECSGTGVPAYRDQAADLASAFRYLQANASTLGLDARRMFVGGHSAGGHLAQLLNLRWDEFSPACAPASFCPEPVGAIGIEGIYDIPAWNVYDAQFWNGRFACATRRAFGAPGPEPPACTEPGSGLRCWDTGSPLYLAAHAPELGIQPAASALLIQSPGDDWVDGRDTPNLAAALETAFSETPVVAEFSGACGSSGHNEVLGEAVLADCILAFVDSTITALPATPINAGHSDAWYDPATTGQGFFVTVWEETGTIFVAWFSYDLQRPPEDAVAVVGEPGHRWFTAQGGWEGDGAELDLYVTAGGVFDAPVPPAQPAERVGSLRLRFSDCETGTASYRFDDSGRSGQIALRRIVTDNVALCEVLGAAGGEQPGAR